jgi:hypothetical protein
MTGKGIGLIVFYKVFVVKKVDFSLFSESKGEALLTILVLGLARQSGNLHEFTKMNFQTPKEDCSGQT